MQDINEEKLNKKRPRKNVISKWKKKTIIENAIVLQDFDKLSPLDIICPICLSIFIEPVSMPCNHSLCMPCFQNNVAQSALACPLCRKRISIWVRKNRKLNKLINEHFWKWLKVNYKQKIETRLAGLEDSDDEYILTTPAPKVCNPGEIRQEYEAQIEKLQAERKMLRLKEEKASEQTILDLQKEEQSILEDGEQEQKNLLLQDLELAKSLQSDDLISNKLSVRNKVGPMDRYLDTNASPKILTNSDEHRTSTPKDLIMQKRVIHPIKATCSNVIATPSSSPILKPSRQLQDITSYYNSESENEQDFSGFMKTPKRSRKTAPNKKSLFAINDDNINKENSDVGKDKVDDDNNEVDVGNNEVDVDNACDYDSEEFDFIEQTPKQQNDYVEQNIAHLFPENNMSKEQFTKMIEEQHAMEARLEQVKTDRIVALKLEKDLKKASAIDRRKGSSDEYNLRQCNLVSLKSPRSTNSPGNKARKKTKRKISDTDGLRQTTLLESLSKKKKIL